MAKGLHKHQAYQRAVQLLGKTLMRRSQRLCELSGETGQLVIYDLEEPREEPSLEEVVHVSVAISECLKGGRLNPAELRCLETAVWSEHSPVRRATVQLLKRIDESWAREALESAMMMGDVE
jgi:hypothetical protein